MYPDSSLPFCASADSRPSLFLTSVPRTDTEWVLRLQSYPSHKPKRLASGLPNIHTWPRCWPNWAPLLVVVHPEKELQTPYQELQSVPWSPACPASHGMLPHPELWSKTSWTTFRSPLFMPLQMLFSACGKFFHLSNSNLAAFHLANSILLKAQRQSDLLCEVLRVLIPALASWPSYCNVSRKTSIHPTPRHILMFQPRNFALIFFIPVPGIPIS